MSQAVIVSIGRTPIGRAVKGSLIDQRPDDLGAYAVSQVLDRVPQLGREEMDRYALRSHQRAVQATRDGVFAREIIPAARSMAMIVERLS